MELYKIVDGVAEITPIELKKEETAVCKMCGLPTRKSHMHKGFCPECAEGFYSE